MGYFCGEDLGQMLGSNVSLCHLQLFSELFIIQCGEVVKMSIVASPQCCCCCCWLPLSPPPLGLVLDGMDPVVTALFLSVTVSHL